MKLAIFSDDLFCFLDYEPKVLDKSQNNYFNPSEYHTWYQSLLENELFALVNGLFCYKKKKKKYTEQINQLSRLVSKNVTGGDRLGNPRSPEHVAGFRRSTTVLRCYYSCVRTAWDGESIAICAVHREHIAAF